MVIFNFRNWQKLHLFRDFYFKIFAEEDLFILEKFYRISNYKYSKKMTKMRLQIWMEKNVNFFAKFGIYDKLKLKIFNFIR